jgi:hypothetical protein
VRTSELVPALGGVGVHVLDVEAFSGEAVRSVEDALAKSGSSDELKALAHDHGRDSHSERFSLAANAVHDEQ